MDNEYPVHSSLDIQAWCTLRVSNHLSTNLLRVPKNFRQPTNSRIHRSLFKTYQRMSSLNPSHSRHVSRVIFECDLYRHCNGKRPHAWLVGNISGLQAARPYSGNSRIQIRSRYITSDRTMLDVAALIRKISLSLLILFLYLGIPHDGVYN
jgi:hypothetical protein